MVTDNERDLAGLPVVHDGESLVAHSAPEAPVPMEVDPTARISLHGDLDLASRPSYAQVAVGARAIGPPPSVPIHA